MNGHRLSWKSEKLEIRKAGNQKFRKSEKLEICPDSYKFLNALSVVSTVPASRKRFAG